MNVRGVELTAVFMVYRVIIYSTQVSYSRQANYSSYDTKPDMTFIHLPDYLHYSIPDTYKHKKSQLNTSLFTGDMQLECY